ncbi:MAG: thioesterase family protein [Alteraurantiacibacter sp.]
MAFQTTALVRFAHVDGAGIVFYPRYFEMLNGAVEDWFARDLGSDFHAMHSARGIGVPTVQLSAQFLAPSMLGEDLTIRLDATRIGRSSCDYTAAFTCDGRDRVHVSATLVCMELAAQTAVPWPDDLRLAMSRHLMSAG